MAKVKLHVTERDTQVLVAPVITEKANLVSENGQVAFHIAPDATKLDVKKAVEALYGVTVEKVNTVNIQGKTKRFKGAPGKRKDIRKAYVCLKKGDSIDFTAGI